jgi:hypothetical protein
MTGQMSPPQNIVLQVAAMYDNGDGRMNLVEFTNVVLKLVGKI